MKRIKPLSKTQRAAAWRIARRYIAHAINGNDPFRGTDGMTTQLRTLHAGRRLGRRIFSRVQQDSHLLVERGIVIIKTERHAGKIGCAHSARSGWIANEMPLSPGGTIMVPSAHAVIIRRNQPREMIRIRYGFPSERQARTWLLTPEGQDELRKAFLKIKPE